MVNGQFLGDDSSAPPGQDIVTDLLGRCYMWSNLVLERYRVFII